MVQNRKKIQIVALLLLFTSVLWANDSIPVLKKWVIKKGRQHANHLLNERFVSKPTRLRWRVRLGADARYVLRDKNGKIDVDQFDWLKLHGITFTPLRTMRNTAMIGWRYNVEKDSFDLNAYFHQNGERFFNDVCIRVGTNEVFETEIKLDYAAKNITVSVITPRGRLTETRPYRVKRFPNRVFFIHPFFGGTTKAPHKISLYSERIKNQTVNKSLSD
jgi:hypothetical protein